jgi:hypothetical protein
MPLVLRNCDPDPEQLARGLEAAHAVLAEAGVTPRDAWLQSGYHVAWTDATAMRAWYRAEDAAVRAVFGSWREAPMAVAMEWEGDPLGAESAP